MFALVHDGATRQVMALVLIAVMVVIGYALVQVWMIRRFDRAEKARRVERGPVSPLQGGEL